jgi:magnesium chelatase family protein
MLVAAMNPCACGFRDSGDGRCICTPYQLQQYDARVSGPLLDRFDLHIEVPPLPEHRMADRPDGASSEAVAARILEARGRQQARLAGAGNHLFANSQLGPRELREYCVLDAAGESLLRGATRNLGFSARAYHRVLRIARTIADLAGRDAIGQEEVAEAIQYRTPDRARRGRGAARRAS